MSTKFSLIQLILIFGYGVPTVLCLMDHLFVIFSSVRKDILLKRKGNLYFPSMDFAEAFALIFTSICPLVNLLLLIFDIFPRFFRKFFTRIRQFLDSPLVKPNERPKTLY